MSNNPMTQEHEEAKTVGAIRMKHPLERGAKCWIFTDEQLAALIADVRRQAMEELARLRNGDYAADQWACAELLRARLDSPSGKEEGK